MLMMKGISRIEEGACEDPWPHANFLYRPTAYTKGGGKRKKAYKYATVNDKEKYITKMNLKCN